MPRDEGLFHIRFGDRFFLDDGFRFGRRLEFVLDNFDGDAVDVEASETAVAVAEAAVAVATEVGEFAVGGDDKTPVVAGGID